MPTTCDASCAAIWVPFLDDCGPFLTDSFGTQFDSFSANCMDAAYGVALPCDAAYLTSGANAVRAACCSNPSDCDRNGFPTGACTASCQPVFEQYFARCTDAVKSSGFTRAQFQTFAASCHATQGAHDDCASSPCQGGGRCTSDTAIGGYTCSCAAGFEGANCEHAVTACRGGALDTAQWRGDYFNGPALDEAGARRPHNSACEDTIPHYDWGDGAPASLPKSRDNFSVRWTADLTLAAGTYEITVSSDDGSVVKIDGIPVLDHWSGCCSTWSTRVALPAGDHQFVYEYRELGGGANANLDIAFITHGIIDVPVTDVSNGASLQGQIDVAGSHQQYRFVASAGTNYAVDATSAGIPGMTVTLYDNDDVTVLASGNNFEWTALADGQYLVQVEGASPTDTGDYSLSLTASGGPCSPGGQVIDATQAGSILFYDQSGPPAGVARCEWHLTCGVGQTVVLTFGRFDTEQGYDFVNVYDGVSDANALIGSYSGSTAPTVGLTGSTMLMTYISDETIGGHGFDAQFSCSGNGVAAVELTPGPPETMTLGRGEVGVYVLEMTVGSNYVITLRPTPGHAADLSGTPSFRLLDGNRQQLDEVAVGSDSAILMFAPSTTGAYTIVVSSGSGDGGDFMLSYTAADDACAGAGASVFPTHDGVIDQSMIPARSSCIWNFRCLPGETVTVTLDRQRPSGPVTPQGFELATFADSDGVTAITVPASGMVSSTASTLTLTANVPTGGMTLKATHGCRGGSTLTIEVGTGPRTADLTAGQEAKFQFTAVAGTTYQLETSLQGLPDSVMTLYGTDATTVLAENDDDGSLGPELGGLNSFIEWTCPADGTYVVGVSGFAPSQTGGFALTITDVDLGPGGGPCGATGLDLPSPGGVIEFFDGTTEGQDCNWHLDCGQGQTATVTFDALSTEAGYDFVWIFDGDSHDDPVVTQQDGDQGNPCSGPGCGPFSSSGSRVTVAFTSDASVNDQGFRAHYSCSGSAGPAMQAVATDGTPLEDTIATPGDQLYYSFDAVGGSTYTLVTALNGLPDTVMDLLDTDRQTQLLTNDDAPGGTSLSSEITWTCPTSGTYYIMVRAFDAASMTGGFRLIVTTGSAATHSDPCNGGDTLTDPSGVIDYFAGHPDGVQCSWIVTCASGSVPELTFRQFDTEANFDFVIINYGDPAEIAQGIPQTQPPIQLSGALTPAVGGPHIGDHTGTTFSDSVGATNSMVVQFTADGSVSGQGFLAEYECSGGAPLPALSFGVPQIGTLGGGTSQISYAVPATGGRAYTVTADSTADLVITLYAADGAQLLQNVAGANIEWLCAVSATYVIDVSVEHVALGPPPTFTLTVAEGQNHCFTDLACHNADEAHSTACLMAGVTPLAVATQEGDITLQVPNDHIGGGFDPAHNNDGVFPDSTGCAWTFSCPAGQHVLLQATRMDLEGCCDWIDVFDSNEIPLYEADIYATQTTLLQTRPGATGTWNSVGDNGAQLESTGPVMSMAFHADQNYLLSGFDVHYSCVDATTVTSCAVGEWLEQFWGDADQTGAPLSSACIPMAVDGGAAAAASSSFTGINYDWGGDGPTQLPGITDNFSARWAGTMMIFDPADATRQADVDVIFASHSDDGSRITIDGTLALDQWGTCCSTWYTDVLTLSAGPHEIIYELQENGGSAYAELTWEIVTPTVVPACPAGQWTGLYWSNPRMDGEPDFADCVAGEINFDYDQLGGGPTQLSGVADNFAVRWTATLPFAQGRYIFHSHSDDGSRITVDGNVVLDQWGSCCQTWDSSEIELSGNHKIIYEMEENGGGANAHIWWDVVAPPIRCSERQWNAEFFNNNALSGAPMATGCADTLDFDFDTTGGGPPELTGLTDNYSIRWSKVVTFGSDGNYIFTARSDDGSRLIVDGQNVLDHWGECCTTWVSDDVLITAGSHAVVFEYYENGGGAYASLSWEASAGSAAITVAVDNGYEAWLNGQVIGTGDDWTMATTYAVDIDSDYLANNEAVIAIHGTDSGGPGDRPDGAQGTIAGIIAVATQGANTYETGVSAWMCWSSPDGTDAAPPGDWALPGYDAVGAGFTPAAVIADYGQGAWGTTDLCAAGQCNGGDTSMFANSKWIWTQYPGWGAPLQFAYCRLSLGVSAVIVEPPPPAPDAGAQNDMACSATSTSSCAELGWAVRAGTGFDAVCAASTAVGCVRDATFTLAQQTCTSVGGRLCTSDEIIAHITQGSGCSFDSQRIWTSSRISDSQQCDTNAYVTMKGTGANTGLVGDWPIMCTPVDETAAVRCCADTTPAVGGAGCSCPTGTWLAEYFIGTPSIVGVGTLMAQTAAISPDYSTCQLGADAGSTIDYQWGGGAPPQLPGQSDSFTVRWTGTIPFVDSFVTFSVTSDDGSRLWLDGTMILDHMAECCATWLAPAVQMSPGNHDIVYVMQEGGGGAYAVLEWQLVPAGGGLIVDHNCLAGTQWNPTAGACEVCPVGTYGPGGTGGGILGGLCVPCGGGFIDEDQDSATPCTANNPPPPPAGENSLSTAVIATDGVAGMTTWQVTITLGGTATNIYTIYGSHGPGQEMVIPPAFQVDVPFGTNVGGTDPQFWAFAAGCQYDSWLTVGLTEGDSHSSLSSVGVDLTSWSESVGITTSDGAVFWMNPDSAPATGSAVVAQLTVPTEATNYAVKLCAQGRGAGDDWQQCFVDRIGGDGAGGGGH